MVGSVRKRECENQTGGNLLFPDHALIIFVRLSLTRYPYHLIVQWSESLEEARQ